MGGFRRPSPGLTGFKKLGLFRVKRRTYQKLQHALVVISFYFVIDPFTKHHKLVQNGVFLKLEVLYCSQNSVKSIKIQ